MLRNFFFVPVYLTEHTNSFFFLTHRYFTGHTTNPDGTVQFVKGHTGVKSTIFGVIKILTVAVCNDLIFGVSEAPFSFLIPTLLNAI